MLLVLVLVPFRDQSYYLKLLKSYLLYLALLLRRILGRREQQQQEEEFLVLPLNMVMDKTKQIPTPLS